jgi:MFS family permease
MLKPTTTPTKSYPRQFWLMFTGMIFSTLGATMIWPFLMIYASETLALPLRTVASLMTINATTGLIASILAGPVVDHLGRKWVMVVGLIGNGLCYFFLSQADSYQLFALLLGASGVFSPLYRVGSDAMLADLFPMEQRADAFAMIRMARNIGVAAGPAIGGFVLSISYAFGLYGAAGGLILYGVMLLLFARETLPPEAKHQKATLQEQVQGYAHALKDGAFMRLITAFTLIQMTAAMIWVLFSVYLKTHYQISEQTYGWLPTTNALLVVTCQVFITRRLKKYPTTLVMRLGAIFYVAAPLLIALSEGFWGFWMAMVILTWGELIVVPSASAMAANVAPIDKRGRYMSLYGLTWNLAAGISPLFGGMLSDSFGPKAPWFGGVITGLLAVIAFWWLDRRASSSPKITT